MVTLRAPDRTAGAARVLWLGEATHGSHDFFALKDRVFRHLVEEKGFCTCALEAPWTTGRRLDDFVVHGTGDPRRSSRIVPAGLPVVGQHGSPAARGGRGPGGVRRGPAERDRVDQAARQCSYDFECIGTGRPGAPCAVALARGHDVLIHLPRVEAARWRGRESTTA
ncbi:erythromycin esterase family protein [Streptomyces sp. NPDC058294]|uniref:erythromycin esterase family protein n=1 Tax=Streptomyces sp. NPDC058294 TaxID=3346430 RepID=UPI0036E4693F